MTVTVNVLLPIAKLDVSKIRKIRSILLALHLKGFVDYVIVEAKMNFGVIGNSKDCQELVAAVLEARDLNATETALYGQKLLVEYFKNGMKPSKYRRIL